MPFVLDASVAATWALNGEGQSLGDLALQRVQTDTAFVSGIWWYELRNILLVNESRDRISSEQSAEFLSALDALSIEIRPPGAGGLALGLARNYRLSVYDAAYLALAVSQDLPLATLDKRLQAAADSENLPRFA